MKIIHENYAYIQKKDIKTMYVSSDLNIPHTLIAKAIGDSKDGINAILEDENQEDYIFTTDKEDIDFLKKVDWVVDFNELNALSNEEQRKLFNDTIHEYMDLLYEFKSMTKEEKERNMSLYLKIKLLNFKYNTLLDIINYKGGIIDLNLPKDNKVEEKSNKTLLNEISYK